MSYYAPSAYDESQYGMPDYEYQQMMDPNPTDPEDPLYGRPN